MDLKNRLRVALGLEADVVLAVQEKLLDGTIVVSSAEMLEVGADISVLAEDGNTILLAPGSYELENGTQFIVEVEGIISEILETEEVIEEVEETEEVEVEEEVEASAEVVAPAPKKIKETKEYEFSKEEVITEITNVVSELLAEAQKDVDSIRAELTELKAINTKLNTDLTELSNEPATEEIVLNKFSDNTKVELSQIELKKLSTRDRVKYNLEKLRK
tara:strand:- start:18 stop:671 length:654 start_codon:yes stop_codon:yes gene_type:complete